MTQHRRAGWHRVLARPRPTGAAHHAHNSALAARNNKHARAYARTRKHRYQVEQDYPGTVPCGDTYLLPVLVGLPRDMAAFLPGPALRTAYATTCVYHHSTTGIFGWVQPHSPLRTHIGPIDFLKLACRHPTLPVAFPHPTCLHATWPTARCSPTFCAQPLPLSCYLALLL